jgi:ketosteroid isomerase-like protein
MKKTVGFIGKSRLVVIILVVMSTVVPAQETSTKAEQAIRKTHNAWFNALLKEDVTSLDSLLSGDVTLSFPGGNLMPRMEFLSYFKAGELFYDSAQHVNSMIRVYGETGIVTGQSNLAFRFKGNAGSERLRYTAVYIRKDGRWLLTAWQSTILPVK